VRVGWGDPVYKDRAVLSRVCHPARVTNRSSADSRAVLLAASPRRCELCC
jgi:hypothetical protein